jgi:hypothetical protein
MEEIESNLKTLVRLHLRTSIAPELYVECLQSLIGLGFPNRDEARWMRQIADTLVKEGDIEGASTVFKEALKLDPALPNTIQLRKKLKV